MSSRPPIGPWPFRAALALAAAVVAVRSALLVAGGVESLQALSLTDPIWPALAVLLALLVAPYVSEVQAVGTRVVRRESVAQQTSGELAELASAEPGEQAALSPDEEAELAASRFVGLQLALLGAAPLFPELAPPLRLHLYVPDDTGRLVPVLEHDDDERAWSRGWDPGVGVVGRAFARRRVQSGRGRTLLDELEQLPDKPVASFGDLAAVVAVPLLNLAGRPVGVLAAAAPQAAPDPDAPELRRALEALGSGMTRVLIDLAGWDTDSAGGAAGVAGAG